jgi:hypothetical protein
MHLINTFLKRPQSGEAAAPTFHRGRVCDGRNALQHAGRRQDGDRFRAFAQLGAQDELAIMPSTRVLQSVPAVADATTVERRRRSFA